MISNERGFTLLELIVVIVVVAIMAGGIMMSFNVALQTNLSADYTSTAIQLAESRMEFLLGYRSNYGYSGLTSDPCAGSSPPAICSTLSGYTVTGTIGTDNGTYKTITVTVTGTGSATLTSEVYNY